MMGEIDLTLQRYEIFNKVVELKNITRAGEALNLTQSTVSHALKNLEEELGFRLLVRNHKGIRLTREGEKIYHYTRKIMYLNDLLLQEAEELKGVEKGCVRVGTFASVTINWIPTIFKVFEEKYPGISIELVEDDYEGLERAVQTGEIDCCFTIKSPKKKINFIPLKKDKLYCIVSKENPLHKQKKIKIKQLEEYPVIKPKKGWDYEIETLLKQYEIQPKVEYEISDDQSILALVQANIGINIRPELVLQNIPHNIVPLDFEEDAYRVIGIGYNECLSPAGRKFVQTVIDLYQEYEQD